MPLGQPGFDPSVFVRGVVVEAERGEQRRCAMTHVVMRYVFHVANLHRLRKTAEKPIVARPLPVCDRLFEMVPRRGLEPPRGYPH